MKERVETKQRESTSWLSAAFEKKAQQAPCGDFLEGFREQQFARFNQRGLPSRREEAWKYTDLSFLEKTSFNESAPGIEALLEKKSFKDLILARAKENILLVFVNGRFVPQLSASTQLPEGVVLSNIQQSIKKDTALLSAYLLREQDVERYPLACLNAALFSDGLFLYLPRSTILEKPLHVLSVATGGQGFMTHTRHLVVLESDTQLTFTEEYLSEGAEDYLTNVSVDFFVGRNALLNYYKVQNEASKAKHFATTFIHQKQNSSVNACSFTTGGQFSRNDLLVNLQEPHAACRMNGFYGLDADGQLIDHHIYIDHAASHTQSAMDYRGVLAKQSRAVFNGKVHVRSQAKKTQAHQLNHNLLLSPLAEIDTKPELEIYADEVQCRHGATVGQLDEDILFYLGARGIDRPLATIILLQAFVEAVLTEVTLPWLVQVMHDQWGRRLATL